METYKQAREGWKKEEEEARAKSPYKHKDVYIERTMVWEETHTYTLRCPGCKAFVHFTIEYQQVVDMPLGGKSWADGAASLPEYDERQWMPARLCPDCGIECRNVSPSSIDTFSRVVPTGNDLQEVLDIVEETRPDLAGQERRGGGGCSVTV